MILHFEKTLLSDIKYPARATTSMPKYICDMLESLLYKYSPCKFIAVFLCLFVHWSLKKLSNYQWEIFCSTKTTKFLGKKPLVLTPLACWAGPVLLAHEHVLFTSLHSIPLNSFVHWLTPPLL